MQGATASKDSDLNKVSLELTRLSQKSSTKIRHKDKESIGLPQQIQDMQNAAATKDSDPYKVTLELNRIRQSTSAELHDLKSNATRDANTANDLRQQLHSLQLSSEAESSRLQHDIDSERVTAGESSRQVELQKLDLEENQVQVRDQEAALASKEQELARIKEGMEDLKGSADSGMDQLEYERDQAEKERDQIAEQLKESRAEVRRLRADEASRRQTGNGRQRLTGLLARRPRDASADHEDEESDESIILQRDRRSVTGVHGRKDAPRRSGRKRKSADMVSDDGEEPTS